jgi:uncharacterized protein YbjT (DUF2867 family)
MNNNILVIGGTGKTGSKVAQSLKMAKQQVRIGSRNQPPFFDWNDPSTWSKALQGMDKVYITYYPDLAVPGAYEAVEGLMKIARKTGVKKAVLLSGKGEKEAERCEQVVANSGLDYTLVRASWFNQNFSESFLLDPILAGVVALPMSHVRIPFVDTTDIAEAVVKALLDDGTNGKTYEITGPRALTFEEVVSEIAACTGRAISFQPVSLEQYSSMMKSAGLSSDYIWLFDYLFREVLGNEKNQVVTRDVERLLGRKATDFSTYVQRTAQTGVWNQVIPQSV